MANNMSQENSKASDGIRMSDSVSVRTESVYLLQSHRNKARDLLVSSDLTQHDIMDALVSLHIVLEVGINTFFRQIFPFGNLRHIFDSEKTIENLDAISFTDKVAMFLYAGSFSFANEEERKKAGEYQKIIGEIKRFSEMRNKLLHGHSIGVLHADGKKTHSALSKKLNLDTLQKQVVSFHTILEGVAFFFEHCTQGGFTEHGKQQYIEAYLDTAFLPVTHFSGK